MRLFGWLLFLFTFLFLIKPHFAGAQDQKKDNKVTIYLFWGDGCPHCAREKAYLKKLVQKYPQLKVIQYEVWNHEKNKKLAKEVGKQLNVNAVEVPFTVIGEKYFIGWHNEETSGPPIEAEVKKAIKYGYKDVVSGVIKKNK